MSTATIMARGVAFVQGVGDEIRAANAALPIRLVAVCPAENVMKFACRSGLKYSSAIPAKQRVVAQEQSAAIAAQSDASRVLIEFEYQRLVHPCPKSETSHPRTYQEHSQLSAVSVSIIAKSVLLAKFAKALILRP